MYGDSSKLLHYLLQPTVNGNSGIKLTKNLLVFIMLRAEINHVVVTPDAILSVCSCKMKQSGGSTTAFLADSVTQLRYQ